MITVKKYIIEGVCGNSILHISKDGRYLVEYAYPTKTGYNTASYEITKSDADKMIYS